MKEEPRRRARLDRSLESWDDSDLDDVGGENSAGSRRRSLSRRRVFALKAKRRLQKGPAVVRPQLSCHFSFRLSQNKFQHWDQALVLLARMGYRLYYLSEDMARIAQLLYPPEDCERSYLFFQDQVLIVISSGSFAKPVIVDLWSRRRPEASQFLERLREALNQVLAADVQAKAELLRSSEPSQIQDPASLPRQEAKLLTLSPRLRLYEAANDRLIASV